MCDTHDVKFINNIVKYVIHIYNFKGANISTTKYPFFIYKSQKQISCNNLLI